MKNKVIRVGRCRAAVLLATLAMLGGCVPLAVTSFGIGASTAVSTNMAGITYRTFTASEPRVRRATLAALGHMDITLVGGKKTRDGEVLTAKATRRKIDITLERLTPNVTRMEVVAHTSGLFYDSATAIEIILQTEHQLGHFS